MLWCFRSYSSRSSLPKCALFILIVSAWFCCNFLSPGIGMGSNLKVGFYSHPNHNRKIASALLFLLLHLMTLFLFINLRFCFLLIVFLMISLLLQKKLHKFELACLANLCPETAEESKALIPRLVWVMLRSVYWICSYK